MINAPHLFDFAKTVLGIDAEMIINNAIMWIAEHLQPEDIFGRDQLDAASIEYVSEHMDPGDVFHRDKLDAWAKAAGYELKSET